ncbi:hypothetical protein BYT27DRAFT_7152515 [Phlegmacium glaucopus]|nr:hypothetical protein BYT27DRAFT_7152515 [Phlegmacium glaucopus]
MLKCRELSRLTKVPRFTSILWRNQTPGSPQSVLDNSYVYLARHAQSQSNGSSTSKVATLLDPSHPATKLKPQQIPSWQADGIKVRLVPMALLQKPESMCSGEDPFSRPFMSWAERIQHAKKAGIRVVSTVGGGHLCGAHNQRIDDSDLYPKSELGNKRLPGHRSVPQGALKDLALKKLALRIPMSYLTATSKERMGSKRYMRRRITTRIKTALNLIVARGAYVDQNEVQKGTGQLKEDMLPRLKFDNEEASLMGRKWIMQGWSYIFYPTTEVYNMPYPKLVILLRQGLQSLYKSAATLERQWLKEALLTQPLPRSKRQQTDPSRTNKGTPKLAIEPSTNEHQVEAAALNPSPDSTYGVVEKSQESDPKRVRRIKSPTAVKPELWEVQLRSGLAIMQERLGKRT